LRRKTKDVRKNNNLVPLKKNHVKNHMFIFVNSLIENPSFDSQTKDTLTTNILKFGSKCKLSDDFYKKFLKSGIIGKNLFSNEL
jgi:DNA topoisomerase II